MRSEALKFGVGLASTAAIVAGCSQETTHASQHEQDTLVSTQAAYKDASIHISAEHYVTGAGCLAEVSRTAVVLAMQPDNQVKANTYYLDPSGQSGGVSIEKDSAGNWRYAFNFYPQQANNGIDFRLQGAYSFPTRSGEDSADTIRTADLSKLMTTAPYNLEEITLANQYVDSRTVTSSMNDVSSKKLVCDYADRVNQALVNNPIENK